MERLKDFALFALLGPFPILAGITAGYFLGLGGVMLLTLAGIPLYLYVNNRTFADLHVTVSLLIFLAAFWIMAIAVRIHISFDFEGFTALLR